MADDRERRLNELFASYRSACPDPEPSANFGPAMWQRIEARRSPVLQWAMMSKRALVGATALCLVLGAVLGSAITNSPFYQSTYVEVLDASDVPDELAGLQPLAVEMGGALSAGQQ